MATFTFTDKMRVGVKNIDDQHIKLVGYVNELFDAMKTGKGKDILGKLLKDLVAYTFSHFGTEEKLMAAHSYPEKADHMKAHEDFRKKVAEFEREFTAGKATITIALGNFLTEWLTLHIMNIDKKFGAFLVSKGVS